MEANVGEPNPVITLVMFAIISIPIAVTAYKLAKEKGRNVTLWTILGCLPLVNFSCLQFFVGATNLRLEKKIDDLLAKQNNNT